ncbi:hypothetical protein SDC9_71855 [bioreactor metagenome]|uniref:Uncharacterized protein n=1 Tax=bioreactor metagenome TaxID=1076179 RepID=A0A644YGX7_9ZZZZ
MGRGYLATDKEIHHLIRSIEKTQTIGDIGLTETERPSKIGLRDTGIEKKLQSFRFLERSEILTEEILRELYDPELLLREIITINHTGNRGQAGFLSRPETTFTCNKMEVSLRRMNVNDKRLKDTMITNALKKGGIRLRKVITDIIETYYLLNRETLEVNRNRNYFARNNLLRLKGHDIHPYNQSKRRNRT